MIRPVHSKPRHNSGRNVAAAMDFTIFGEAPDSRLLESPWISSCGGPRPTKKPQVGGSPMAPSWWGIFHVRHRARLAAKLRSAHRGQAETGLMKFRSSNRGLFPIGRVKPVYESALPKFIDERFMALLHSLHGGVILSPTLSRPRE